jgi:hypothetical protein
MATWYGYIDTSSANSTTAASGYYTVSNSTSTDSTSYYYSPVYSNYYTYPRYTQTYATPSTPKPETEEQRKSRMDREAIYNAEQKKRDEEKEAAIAKAEELLKAHVGQKRYQELCHSGHIELDSQKYAGRKYRVGNNAHSRIEVLENGKVIDELCIISQVEIPRGDLILSKVVMMECAEEEALAIANHFRR